MSFELRCGVLDFLSAGRCFVEAAVLFVGAVIERFAERVRYID